MKLFLFFVAILSLMIDHCAGVESRIFDGFDADINDFPWMVSVRFSTVTHLCGGAILSEDYILTGASCIPALLLTLPNLLVVKAGINRLVGGNETTEQTRNVSQIILHPNFNSSMIHRNNVALLRLSQPWDLINSNLSTIALSNLTSVEDLDLVTLGWGYNSLSNQSTLPVNLQQAIIKEDVQCTQNKLEDPSTQLCAPGNK